MAYYAFMDENNIVIEVITGKSGGNFDWESYYGNLRMLLCKETNYDENFAGIGYSYDPDSNSFVAPLLAQNVAQAEADKIASEAKFLADQPMREWGESMAASDLEFPRWAEDLYDALPLEIRDAVNPVTKNKIIQKKSQRTMKPSA